MAARSLIPPLTDIVEAIERIRDVLGDSSLDAFEADWQKQWLIERGVEIVSEASRRLTAELKARNPDIPWAKVAGIGNVLRHDYGNIAAPHHLETRARRFTAARTRLPCRTCRRNRRKKVSGVPGALAASGPPSPSRTRAGLPSRSAKREGW